MFKDKEKAKENLHKTTWIGAIVVAIGIAISSIGKAGLEALNAFEKDSKK